MIIDAREKFLKRADSVERTVYVMNSANRQVGEFQARNQSTMNRMGASGKSFKPSAFSLDIGRNWFKESHDLIVLNGDKLAKEFFRRIFLPIWWRSPQFLEAVVEGQDRFIHSLIATLHDPEEPKVLSSLLSEIWIRYRGYGAMPADYCELAAVLLSVIRDVLGEYWSDETDVVWSEVLKADNVFSLAPKTLNNITKEDK